MVLNLFKALGTKQEVPSNRTRFAASNAGDRMSAVMNLRKEIPLPEAIVTRTPPVMTAAAAHSFSAPNSPASRSSIPRNVPRCQPSSLLVNVRPPAPNICVEQGRIEFVKTEDKSPTTTSAAVTTTTTATTCSNIVEKNRPAQMGSKIFRPQLRKPEVTAGSKCSEEVMTPGSRFNANKWKTNSNHDSISIRERSASPRMRDVRESTPTREPMDSNHRKLNKRKDIPVSNRYHPPESALLMTQSASAVLDRQSVPVENHPPIRDVSSRESCIPLKNPAVKATRSAPAAPIAVTTAAAAAGVTTANTVRKSSRERSPSPGSVEVKQVGKQTMKSAKGIPVPVSPNLIRWKAKLSKTDKNPIPHRNNTKTDGILLHTTSNSTAAIVKRTEDVGPVNKVAEKSNESPTSTPNDKAKRQQTTKPTILPNNLALEQSGTTIKTDNNSVFHKEVNTNECDAMEPTLERDMEEDIQDEILALESNQMQLNSLHYEVKRLKETVKSLLPLRQQHTTLVQTYEQRLAELQSRISCLEAENQALKSRLVDRDNEQLELQKIQNENVSLMNQLEQQTITFDKCLDDIANHMFQALILQKNLQGECRRLRSQISDLEQRNVALNLLLTQSLRESMTESKKDAKLTELKAALNGETFVHKSTSFDGNIAADATGRNPRDSLCSVVSDSEIRFSNCSSLFPESNSRPLISKDNNWTMTQGQGLPQGQGHFSPLTSPVKNPMERADQLLAILKHRLFSAQLNSSKNSGRNKSRHSLHVRDGMDMTENLPARPNTLSFLPESPTPQKVEQSGSKITDPSTPSVRALVQVLEKRSVNVSPSTASASPEAAKASARPPIAQPIRIVRTNTDNESPVSKDEGYSTMSSDVQVDSSSSSSSSFIASGCSSPATLRRNGSGSVHSASRSLPMAKRKTLTNDPHRQPNRSISLQETHSGAGLEEVKEVIDENEETSKGTIFQISAEKSEFPSGSTSPSLGRETNQEPLSSPGCDQKFPVALRPYKKEWSGLQLGTLSEDWSPSSSETNKDDDAGCKPATNNPETPEEGNEDARGLQKWTSDSELYKGNIDSDSTWRTLQHKGHLVKPNPEPEESHPLRRSRAHIRLAEEPTPTVLDSYSEHEMEDWILRSSSEELIHRDFTRSDGQDDEETVVESVEEDVWNMKGAISLSSIPENGFDIDEETFHNLSSPECGIEARLCQDEAADCDGESNAESTDDMANVEMEFTRDFYRLVKFESNRSLANSEKYDHCAAAIEDNSIPPPDQQEALKNVLDFIAAQQRYCAERETMDKCNSPSVTPELPHPNLIHAEESVLLEHNSLLQLKRFIPPTDEDSSNCEDDEVFSHEGCSTGWISFSRNRGEMDLNHLKVQAEMLDRLQTLSSSSSSSCCASCTTPDSPHQEQLVSCNPFHFNDNSAQGYSRKIYLPTTWENPAANESSNEVTSLPSTPESQC